MQQDRRDTVRGTLCYVYFRDTKKTSRYHTVDTMTRDEMTYRLVEEDLGQPYDKAAADMLSKAIAAHMATAGSAARVTLEPMSREESLRLYADYKKIAAYFMIDV